MDKYTCIDCNYETNILKYYKQHCNTIKHKKNIDNTISKKYICEYCSKQYIKQNSFWYHIQKCKVIYEEILNRNLLEKQKNDEIKELKEEIKQEIKNEINEEIIKLNTKIENVKPNVFNLNVFLNEYCKDAMSIDTFLSQLQIQFTLDNTLQKDSIIALTDALTNMEVNKRPIHCLDLKRNKVCIKDNDEWTNDIKVFDKVPKYIEKVYGKEINKWEERNPGFMDNDEKMSLFIQHMAKYGQVMNSLKILRPIMKVTSIPKKENE